MNRQLTAAEQDARFQDWLASIEEFGGWAHQSKFVDFISEHHDVLDFGCGGGYLLKQIKCRRKIGVEIHPRAIEAARQNGIELYRNAIDVPDDCVDVIISDNALEHTSRPLDELITLSKKLHQGGKLVLVVPCESVTFAHNPCDIVKHLYSLSPMSLGNLVVEAGYSLIESKPYIYKRPPCYQAIARVGGRRLFDITCRLYGRIERSWFQVRAVAEKRSA